jgi:uracil phosphoribosyltransferase
MIDEAATPMRGRAQPDRSAVASLERLRIIENPLSLALLARVRDRRTDIFEFGALSTQLASLILWEACHDVQLAETQVPNFAGDSITVHQLAERVAGVAILRAGLLFAAPFRGILPEAPLHQIGIRRDERSLRAIVYGDNLPTEPNWADRVLILDPMLATGGSAVQACALLKAAGASKIKLLSLIAAPEGIARMADAMPDVPIHVGVVDERLNDVGFICPGLGDAGDRQFGTGR